MGWVPDGLAVLLTLGLVTCATCFLYVMCSTPIRRFSRVRKRIAVLPVFKLMKRTVARGKHGKLKVEPYSAVIVPPTRLLVMPAPSMASPTTPSSVVLSIDSFRDDKSHPGQFVLQIYNMHWIVYWSFCPQAFLLFVIIIFVLCFKPKVQQLHNKSGGKI